MISNHDSKNKLRSAISMSGTGYNVWGLNKLSTAKLVSEHMANVSGCPYYQDSRQVGSCLRNVDADVLVANQLFTFVRKMWKTLIKLCIHTYITFKFKYYFVEASQLIVIAQFAYSLMLGFVQCMNHRKQVSFYRPLNQKFQVHFWPILLTKPI